MEDHQEEEGRQAAADGLVVAFEAFTKLVKVTAGMSLVMS